MGKLGICLRMVSGVVSLALCATGGQGQQYLFTNDNVSGGNNSTTALAVKAQGTLKVLKTYPTGGKSAGSAAFALSPITFAHTRTRYCVFVSNGGDDTVAAFQVNMLNGGLTPVHGSPFADGVTGAQNYGIGLAADSRFLFAGSTNSDRISIFEFNSFCSLKLLKKVAVPGSPAGMKVTGDGKYLIVAYIGWVDSFAINATTGNLTELGPFNTQGSAAGVEISCDGTTVYFGDASSVTQVEVFSINASGGLKEVDNFTNQNGQSSNNVMLSADGKHLYVSNTESNQITTLAVGPNGDLSYDNTVALTKPGLYALGLGAGTSGLDIFVSEQNNPEAIGVLAASGSTLKEVAGSPFQVTKNGFAPAGMTLVPPKACP